MDIERIKVMVQSITPAPLHHKLREAIQAQIMDGTLKPGETLPSERSMKKYFGVSRATVRQAVNSLIQDGFLQSVAGTGTFVLEVPTKLQASGLIGLITSSPNFNFFYPQLTAAFNLGIRQSGYGLVMALHGENADTLSQVVDELLAQNVIALAITPPRYGDISHVLDRLRRGNIPLVFIGRDSPTKGFDVVTTDNEAVGYQATHHLIELGHRHIIHLGLLDYSTGNERAAGYQRAMREAGLPPHIYQLSEDPHPHDTIASGVPREHLVNPAHEAVYQIWGTSDHANNLPQPTAIFCFNDIVAMGAYKALRELRRAIPQDVSLISVDNLITVRHFEVPISTFALPGEAIGQHSAEILLKRLTEDVSRGEVLRLPAMFIPRASTAALSTG